MGDWFQGLVEACGSGLEECRKAAAEFLAGVCSDRSMCESPRRSRRLEERYKWVEDLIKRGVPDGRSRLILYVISRYLVNVKGMEPEEAHIVVREFIENSCRNHGDCSKIYDSWIRNVLRKVKEGGWLPWNLERIRERDPELYDIVRSVLEG